MSTVSNDTKNELEQAICQKANAEFQIAMREWDESPISKERLTKADENIKGSYAPFKTFANSETITIEYYLLPLVKRIIQIESDLRAANKIPFSDERIANLRGKIHEIVKNKWEYVVLEAYEDATKHVIYHNNSGHLPEYKEAELAQMRDRHLKLEPTELYQIIDELLQKASAESKIQSHMQKDNSGMETPEEKRKKLLIKVVSGFVVLILVLIGFAILPAFGSVLWLFFLIIAYPLIIAFTTSEQSMDNVNLVEMYKTGLTQVPFLGEFFSKILKSKRE